LQHIAGLSQYDAAVSNMLQSSHASHLPIVWPAVDGGKVNIVALVVSNEILSLFSCPGATCVLFCLGAVWALCNWDGTLVNAIHGEEGSLQSYASSTCHAGTLKSMPAIAYQLTSAAWVGRDAILEQGVEALLAKSEEVIGVKALHVVCHFIHPSL